MKLNNENRRENRGLIPSDFFLRLAMLSFDKSNLLDNLISKSVAEALGEFLIELKIEERSPKTILFYRDRLKWFIDFIKPDTLLKDIGIGDIKRFFSTQNSQHIYAYHAKYRALRAFLNWCVKQNYTLESPLTFSPPKLPDIIKPAFTDSELKAIINACIGSLGLRNKAIVLTLIDTGIRREELAGIKIADINLDARIISITGKGRKQRLIPVSPTTLKVIWQYIKMRKNPSEFLWLTEEGKPLTGNGIGQTLQNLMKHACITGHKASAHVFRHTFANNFLDNGGDPLDLMYLLGHASLKMVENYSRAHKQRRALKALEKQRPVDRLGLK
ncbi:Tyrosine recombinase XerC [subsurface metagenome]